MSTILTPDEILERAERIRLNRKTLCELADVSESIWAHWRNNPGAAKLETLRKLSEALINEERALLVHLTGALDQETARHATTTEN